MRSFFRIDIRKFPDDPFPLEVRAVGSLVIGKDADAELSLTLDRDDAGPFHEWFADKLDGERHLSIYNDRGDGAWRGLFSIRTTGPTFRMSSSGPIEEIPSD